jgi:FixJ family two-component response regulator
MMRVPSRVLIVDDDASTRIGLSELLSEAGYEVRALGTFEEGLRALRTDPPDLLIADVRLGAFNGLQLLVSTSRSIPAIVITGFADPVLEADARQHGADYLLKPFAPDLLLQLVRRRLPEVQQSRIRSRRRWARKPITHELTAHIHDRPARIVDVSYGGLRFEIPRVNEVTLPSSLSVRLPASNLSVTAAVVWQAAIADHHWMCGAAISQTSPAIAREWRGLVDGIA